MITHLQLDSCVGEQKLLDCSPMNGEEMFMMMMMIIFMIIVVKIMRIMMVFILMIMRMIMEITLKNAVLGLTVY